MDNKNNKEKYKYRLLILLPIVSLLIVVIGVSYAFIQIFDLDNTIAGTLECYTVNYTKGQDISGKLMLGTNYLSGKSTDIVIYSDPNCASMTGTLYLTTNQSSTMDFSDNALRYTVVVDDIVVSEGAVDGTENQVIYTGFQLNTTETIYKVYIWLDIELEDESNTENETYSGFIHAEAITSSSDIVDDPSTDSNIIYGFVVNANTPIIEQVYGFYKISNSYMTYVDLYNSNAILSTGDEVFQVTPVRELLTTYDDGVYLIGEIILNVTKTTTIEGITFEPGIYMSEEAFSEMGDDVSMTVGDPNKTSDTTVSNSIDFILTSNSSFPQVESGLYKISNDLITAEQWNNSRIVATSTDGQKFVMPTAQEGITSTDSDVQVGDGMFVSSLGGALQGVYTAIGSDVLLEMGAESFEVLFSEPKHRRETAPITRFTPPAMVAWTPATLALVMACVQPFI